MTALYYFGLLAAAIAVIAATVWIWGAIDRYHWRCAIRETEADMRHRGFTRQKSHHQPTTKEHL